MKKDKNEIMRLQTMIENDRMNIGENFDELIMCDLNKLLSDFFDYKECPTLEISKVGDKLKVNISLTASRMRSFGVVSK